MKILGLKRLDLVLEDHCSVLRKSSTISSFIAIAMSIYTIIVCVQVSFCMYVVILIVIIAGYTIVQILKLIEIRVSW